MSNDISAIRSDEFTFSNPSKSCKYWLDLRSIKRIVKNYIAVLRLIMQDSDQANNCNLMIMADKLENLPANTRQEYIKNLFFIFEENISIFKIIFQDNPKYNIDFYIVLSLLAALSSGAYTVSDRDKRLLEKAVGYGHTALIIWEREVKVDHPKLAFIHQVMATAAEVIEDNGYGHIACECFSKSLNIYVRNLGERHPSSLYAYCMLVQAQAYQDQRFGAEQIFLAIQKIKQALPELIQQEHRSLLHIYYAVLARLYIKLGAIAHRVEIINYLRLFKQSLRESDGSPELIALTSAGASFTILLLLLVQFFVAPGRSLHECGITFFHKATHLDPIEASAMSLSGLIAGCSPGFMWESPTIDSLTFSTLIIHRSLLCLKLPTINANSASVQYKIGIAVVLANLAIKLLEFTFNANKCFLGLTFVAIGLISIVNHILNYKNDNNTQPQFKPR